MVISKKSSTEGMLEAFKKTLQQASQLDVVDNSTSVESTSIQASEKFMDTNGMFGDPSASYTFDEIKRMWDELHDFDDSMQYFDSFDAWWADTSSFLTPVYDFDELEAIESAQDIVANDSDYELTDEQRELLWNIAERYNTSKPVSGNWDTEAQHEMLAIAEGLNLSEEEAKQVMIDELGFSPESFEAWEELDTKMIHDFDGFLTDYTLYFNPAEGRYVCVFGDRDWNRPEDGYFDYETHDYEEAIDWFNNYTTDDEE